MGHILKYIFISEYYYTKRDLHRYGANYYSEHGIDVEVWTVFPPKSINSKVFYTNGIYQGEMWKNLTFHDMKRELRKLRGENAVVFLMHDFERFLPVVCQYGYRFVLMGSFGPIIQDFKQRDVEKERSPFLQRVYSNLLDGGIRIVFSKMYSKTVGILARIFHEQRLVRVYFRNRNKGIVVGATENIRESLPTVIARDMIAIHSFDYDRYLEVENSENVGEREYIVYIDSGYGCFHTDIAYSGSFDPFSVGERKTEFLNKLNECFDRIERHYGIPIVIAGHPHVVYSEKPFGEREIIFDNTCDLVKHSKFVIFQMSTAVSFVSLYKKKVLCIINSVFHELSEWNRFLIANYDYFGITPCNLDNEECFNEPWKYLCSIEKKAEEYCNVYISELNSPYSKQLVAEVILNLLTSNHETASV